jgi:hypothetical protein
MILDPADIRQKESETNSSLEGKLWHKIGGSILELVITDVPLVRQLTDKIAAPGITAIQLEKHYVPDDVQGEGSYSALLLGIYAWRARCAGGGQAAQPAF